MDHPTLIVCQIVNVVVIDNALLVLLSLGHSSEWYFISVLHSQINRFVRYMRHAKRHYLVQGLSFDIR